ncbi:MAG: HAD-IA family hydrolase [Planctomycetota bacterium]
MAVTNYPEIQLVVFDLGRVLLRIADDWNHAASRARHPELSGLTGDLSSVKARGEHHPIATLLDRFEIGAVTVDDFFRETAAISQQPADALQKVMDAVLIEAFPGTPTLLEQLSRRPVKTACLSNTNARHEALFTDPGHASFTPVHRLDFPLYSHTIGHAKPHAAAYAAVETTTQTDPAHILFFDDLDENTAAAADRGWHTVLVPRVDNPIPLITQHLHAYRVL